MTAEEIARIKEEDRLLDIAAREARDEFRKVRAYLPADPAAHPMSGRCGEY